MQVRAFERYILLKEIIRSLQIIFFPFNRSSYMKSDVIDANNLSFGRLPSTCVTVTAFWLRQWCKAFVILSGKDKTYIIKNTCTDLCK